jgi:copper homeostasis protein (lipoprotein)
MNRPHVLRQLTVASVSVFVLLCSGCCLLFPTKACKAPAPPACCAGEMGEWGVQFDIVYHGVLPCADCPGMEWTLQLFQDNVYYLRTGYLERGENGGTAEYDEVGSYEIRQDLNEVQLISGNGRQRFAVIGMDTLRMLDAHGMTIESGHNEDLVAQPDAVPLEPQLVMTGMYSYMADAGRFRDCRTGRELAVAQEADNAELERKYTAVRKTPGERLLVSFDGKLTTRARPDGNAAQSTVIVEHFVGIWPGDTCGAHLSTASLVNTFWALTWLDGTTLEAPKPEKEIHLLLEPTSGRARGFAGCNTFGGPYAAGATTLTFGPLAATKMYCAEFQQIEDRYLQALGRVASWEVYGEQLELYDAKHELLARFESRYFH